MMRCDVADTVIVVKGPASGAVGVVLAEADSLAKRQGQDWAVGFWRAIPCSDDCGGDTEHWLVFFRDDEIHPIRADGR